MNNFEETNFGELERFFKDSNIQPIYDARSDYTTNAPSYYEYLAKQNHLIKILAQRIYDYDKTLGSSLENIENVLTEYIEIVDGKISIIDDKIGEGFNDEINDLLVEWVNDGTLNHIINEEIFNTKADKEVVDSISEYISNAENPLYIPCSTEKYHNVWDQTTHPDVLFFPTAWNGYKYWMAHTPYPYTNDFYENPEIVASNDGINWIVPKGLVNPIDEVTESQSQNGEHHSDAILVFNGNTGTLECWYRWTNKNSGQDRIYRMVSTNGIEWGNKELVYNPSVQTLSPTVLYENGKYKMWIVQNGTIKYMECVSTEIGNWSTPEIIPFNVKEGERVATLWHIHIFKENDSLYHLLMAEKTGSIYYSQSSDGKTFDNAIELIKPSFTGWDNRHLYRASMIKDSGIYRVYYGGYGNSPGRWRVGLSEGVSPYHLNGSKNKQANGFTYLDRIKGAITDFREIRGEHIHIQNDDYEKSPEFRLVDVGRTGFRLKVADESLNTMEIRSDNDSNRGNIIAQQVFASEIKPNSNTVYLFGNYEIRTHNDIPPSIKLLKPGVAGVQMNLYNPNTLDIESDNGDFHGNIRVGSVIFKDSEVSTVTGGVKYNQEVGKLQLLSGGTWNNLNNYVPNVPASSTSGGNRGDYTTDENYLYVCHRPGNWIRFAKDSNW